MIKILKYLKNSFSIMIIIVLLLCVQAVADLALPEYTSKIVNVGIQQSGIENPSPEILRKSDMDKILIFTYDDEEILERYTLVINEEKENNEKYSKYAKNYSLNIDEDIYVINNLNKEEQENLNNIISKPIMVLATIENEETSSKIKEEMINNVPEQMKEYFKEKSLFEIIETMPEEQLKQSFETFDKQLEEMPESIVSQAAIVYIKTQYEKIGINIDEFQNDYIIYSGIQMLGIALISMTTGIMLMLLSSRVAARLGKDLREKVYKKVLSFSNNEFTDFSTASLITRNTNDVQQIQNIMTMLFRVVIYAPIIGVGGFFKVLSASQNSMAWIIGVAILSILFIVLILFIFVMPKFKKLQELIDKMNLVAREILTGLPVIRAFNTEKHEEIRFDKANTNLANTDVFVNKAMSIMMPLLMLVMNAITILIIWIGAKNIDTGAMQVGDVMAFIQYTMQIVIAFLMISMVSIMLPRASVSANRISEVLDTKERINDPKNPDKFNKNIKGIVEFKNVSFKYPDADEDTLTDIVFTANPGETTAIIGSTGSGKSTIINLIPRFYDVTKGELLIDGVNVKNITQKDLREKIGFVPQKGILFSGTIESNIKYGNKNLSDTDMHKAAEIAQATEFIESKPDKYKTEIAQGGTNVSGGQKQRLSIARAIAIDPEIYIFDDSFSALDYKTDVKLRAALTEKTANKTVIIVAQRINTILHADKIIVLEEGKIAGIGKHKELMETSEVYRQIALSQLSKEELE